MSSASLDLYARIEDLLGIDEATEALHALFLQTLQELKARRFLDIGCGRGGLMAKAAAVGITGVGIDRSPVMVEATRAAGFEAHVREVCGVEPPFDAAVAVFDVLNFIDPDRLDPFLDCVARILRPGGHFIADVNTLHGFANVAEGTMCTEDETRFLCIDAHFDDPTLQTRFTLFSPEGALYRKEEATVTQWFHPLKRFRRHGELKLVQNRSLGLYDRDDKTLLIFKKTV